VRSELDKAVDSLLLTYELKKAVPFLGRTKVQKTTFLIELKLREQHLIGPHFRFFRYTNGPFSREVWDTFDDLANRGFVQKSNFDVTERGQFLLDLIVPPLREIPANEPVFAYMDGVLDDCKGKYGATLMRHIYDLEVAPDELPGERMKIADIPMFVDIIRPESGGLEIPQELASLLLEELTVTQEELSASRKRLPDIHDSAMRRLVSVLDAPERS
jgi:hypothetical protein